MLISLESNFGTVAALFNMGIVTALVERLESGHAFKSDYYYVTL